MSPAATKAKATSIGLGKAKQRIKAVVAQIKQDKKQTKLLLELLSELDLDENQASPPALLVSAVKAVVEVVLHCFGQGQFLFDEGQKEKKAKEDSARQQISDWLWQRLDDAWDRLLALLTNKTEGEEAEAEWESVHHFCLVAAFKLIRAQHKARLEAGRKDDGGDDEAKWHIEEVRRLRRLLQTLCSSHRSVHGKIRRFPEFLEYADVKQQVILGLLKLLKQTTKGEGTTSSSLTSHFKFNLLSFLELIHLTETPSGEPASKRRKDDADDDVADDDSPTFLCRDFSHKVTLKGFNDLWESFLKLRLDADQYKRVLIIVDSQVLPHLTRPLLLTDFLVTSYAVGGAVGILALNGVFTLMQRHNLEYPDFYAKLYALFTPDLMHQKYRARFFHLADLFLTSTHLPEYLVGAFAKRAARIALSAPAPALLMLMPFIGNLLMRHPGLLSKMVHADADVEDAAADPYLPDEADPAKSRALDSRLWEVQTLQSHALPQVAQSAKFISRKLPEMEWDLAEYLELTWDDMVRVETKKKIFVNVPMTIERPKATGLAHPKKQDELMADFFDLC